MTVTAIVPFDKKRDKVFVEGEFAFVLYKGEVRSYQIRENSEIKEAYYEEIMTKLLPRRAKLRALDLLTARSYTEARLFQKLLDGGYPESIAQEAMNYVKSYGYVDDSFYASEYIFYHAKGMSSRQMEQKLLQRGISQEVIRQSLAEYSEREGGIDEITQIRNYLEKKHYQKDHSDEKEYRKLVGALMRKGYKFENISEAFDSFT